MSDTNDSRIEKLLKAILGQEVQLEPRESRVEDLLYAILTGGSHDEPTLSEMEDILLCILNGERYEGPTSSRINALLKVKANGGDYDEPRLSPIEDLIYEWINGGDVSTYTGALPATLQTVAGYLAGYKIYGNTEQTGTPTPENPIMPSECGERTEQLYDISSVTLGKWYTSSGTLQNQAYGAISAMKKINEEQVTVKWHGLKPHSFSYVWFDSNKDFLSRSHYGGASGLADEYTNTVPRNAMYFIIQMSNGTSTSNPITINQLTSYQTMLNLGSTALPYEPYGYKLPILSNDTATDIYIGDTQLAKDEYVDSETGQIYRYVDGILTPTDPPAPLPQIPTAAGETTIDYGAAALPHVTGLDGIFEYGNIDGLTWKNSVSDENDITFDTAVTDTGTEYVLPAGASGQYTSKSGEYRTEFTWYCIAKCPTTCHSAGQYMVSNWNNQGVEISSGWAAYSSAGTNHLVRSINNNDFNSAKTVTNYALIAVSGDVNGVASVYVNGEKMTDNWNFNPVSSSGAATIFLGKRASGQLSGTDIDYKFLAFGITKQTDSEIAANSQYLMTKYLGVGRPEKVELKYR